MSMFDGKLDRLICEFGDVWSTDEYRFRQSLSTVLKDDGSISLMVRANGRSEEFLLVDSETWDRSVKAAVRASRAGSNYATRFFLWHWLEETNQLSLFKNKLKEITNA